MVRYFPLVKVQVCIRCPRKDSWFYRIYLKYLCIWEFEAVSAPLQAIHPVVLILGCRRIYWLGIRGSRIRAQINLLFSTGIRCLNSCWSRGWYKIRIVESGCKSIVVVGICCRRWRHWCGGIRRLLGSRFVRHFRRLLVFLGKFDSKGGSRSKALRYDNFIDLSIRSLYVDCLARVYSFGECDWQRISVQNFNKKVVSCWVKKTFKVTIWFLELKSILPWIYWGCFWPTWGCATPFCCNTSAFPPP